MTSQGEDSLRQRAEIMGQELRLWRTCLTCCYFDETIEVCRFARPPARPPARVIAQGCTFYDYSGF